MRILLGELKKIFCDIKAVAALIIAALLIYLNFRGLYAYNVFERKELSRSLGSYYLDTFEWFTNNYGYRIDDEVIAQIDELTFPGLDEFIASRPEFAALNIYNTEELKDFYMENLIYRGERDHNFVMNQKFKDSFVTQAEYWDMNNKIFRLKSSVSYLYFDYYISQDEYLASLGIHTYNDNGWYSEFDENDNEIEYTDEEIEERNKFIDMVASYIHSNYEKLIENPAIPELDNIPVQWCRLMFVIGIKQLYGEIKANAAYTMTVANQYKSRTVWIYKEEVDKELVPTDKPKVSDIVIHRDPAYNERIERRAERLGVEYYTIKPYETTYIWENVGRELVVFAACAGVLLAGIYAVSDKRGTLPVLYCTKTGRRLAAVKTGAVCAAPALLIFAATAVSMIIMLFDECAPYFGLSVNSFYTAELFWVNVDMWGYVLLYALISAVASAGISVVTFTVCGFCKNIISAFTVSLTAGYGVVQLFNSPLNSVFAVPRSELDTPLWVGGIVVIAAACAVFYITKEKGRVTF